MLTRYTFWGLRTYKIFITTACCRLWDATLKNAGHVYLSELKMNIWNSRRCENSKTAKFSIEPVLAQTNRKKESWGRKKERNISITNARFLNDNEKKNAQETPKTSEQWNESYPQSEQVRANFSSLTQTARCTIISSRSRRNAHQDCEKAKRKRTSWI